MVAQVQAITLVDSNTITTAKSMFTSNWRDIAFALCLFFFSPSSPLPNMQLQLNVDHHAPATLKRKQAEWHIVLAASSAFFPGRLKEKVLHLPLESEKPSEIHGTCTHSPSLSSAFEGMTATSQRVKILKPTLGSPTVFFFFFFFFLLPASSGNRGSYRHHSIHFISLALAPSLLSSSEGSVWPPNTLLLFSI